jgi:hypothetical protein
MQGPASVPDRRSRNLLSAVPVSVKEAPGVRFAHVTDRLAEILENYDALVQLCGVKQIEPFEPYWTYVFIVLSQPPPKILLFLVTVSSG